MRHSALLISSLALMLAACAKVSTDPAPNPGSTASPRGGDGASSTDAVGNGGTVGKGGSTTNSSRATGSSTLAEEGGSSQTSDTESGGTNAATSGTVATGGGMNSGGKVGGGGTNSGGKAGSGGTKANGSAATGGGSSSGTVATGGKTTNPTTGICLGNCTLAAAGSCASPEVRISQVNLGAALNYDTSETGVMPLAISAKPGGGSRLAWMTGYATNASSTKGQIHVQDLDCDDKPVGSPFAFEGHDFQDIAADGDGGTILLTRDAEGGGTLNCGAPSSLCGTPPNPAVACYDMYMVKHDCSGNEQWATKLTASSATQAPYSAGSGNNFMVWWYQHHGRLASDGTNHAAYFCDGIVVKNGSCVDIHQGDAMKVVGPTGSLLTGHDSFELGCSHSGFTRIIWDEAAGRFAMVCKTDNSNRIAQPNPYRTVLPITLDGSFLGDLIVAKPSGYWLTASNAGSVHLLHFETGKQADQDKNLGSANYPHLVAYGKNNMIAVWSSAIAGNMTAQVFDTSGTQVSSTFTIGAPNHPYQSFKSFPDGSAAFATVGSSSATIQVVRVMPCE